MVSEDQFELQCRGITCCSVVVPKFNLAHKSVVGISIPIPVGDGWLQLMKTLSGEVEHPDIELLRTGVSVIPQLGIHRVNSSLKVGDALQSLGYGKSDYGLIHAGSGITFRNSVRQLPATSRLLIEILSATERPDTILVFSTCGLDPVGVKTTIQFVVDSGRSALHVFSNTLCSAYVALGMYDEVVKCNGT